MSDSLTLIVEPPVQILELNSPGPQGPVGSGEINLVRQAATALSGHRVVKAIAGDKVGYPNLLTPADCDLLLGVTRGAAAMDADVTVQASGVMVESTWAWSLGPVFCGASGVLTQTIPSGAGEWLRQIGIADAPTRLLIDLRPPIILI